MRVVIPESLHNERVDRVIAMFADISRSRAAALIDAGAVMLDNKIVRSRSHACAFGQTLEVTVAATEPQVLLPNSEVDFDVVYEDDHIFVINKPAGVVVHPGNGVNNPTLIEGILARYPDLGQVFSDDHVRPGIVHRLDVGTSGALVIARTREAKDILTCMMQNREVHRRYKALVWGELRPDRGTIDAPIGRSSRRPTSLAVKKDGKHARTHYEVCARSTTPAMTYVFVQLETGRTHQIRVHFSAIGHPVVGDAQYRGMRDEFEIARPFLHAAELEFHHPVTHEPLFIRIPLPRELAAILSDLAIVDTHSHANDT